MSEPDTIDSFELTMMSIDHRLGRLADAGERAANALETLVALFASVTGVGRATCYPSESNGDITTPIVNYIRTGNGGRFRCDASADDDNDGNEVDQ